ncbi:hypothetical protein AMTR_s00111p00045560 [Amborella trichopoda]|uniref:Sphingomyelin phosphodiesterase 4 n=2 Tax=Amborella trichopoda TaxID=13333 RepID=W1NWZ8_AMBTC|nr:hypothetical protein AMTR_s00111p00045560 [Amborella trichopoda]
MDSHHEAQDLSSLLLRSCSPPQILASISAIESFLSKYSTDQSRTFYAQVFPTLLCKLFGFHDTSPWISQFTNEEPLCTKIFDLLSPSGRLISSIHSIDRHSLIKYVFPTERLPEWIRFLLNSDINLFDSLPLLKNRVQKESIKGVYQVQLNVFEYYIFWFAYYPVCKAKGDDRDNKVVNRKVIRARLERWASSLPVFHSNRRSGQKAMNSDLYSRLLCSYLQAFVPNYGSTIMHPGRTSSLLHYSSKEDAQVSQRADFFVHTLIHYWLVDNDFSPLSVKFCRSFWVSLPFRNALLESPPCAGLGEVVKVLVMYLNSSLWICKEEMGCLEYAQSSRLEDSSSFGLLVQRPLYRMILRAFQFCPIGTNMKKAAEGFELWVCYLEPWKNHSWDKSDVSDVGEKSKGRADSSGAYTSWWQGYVVSNYPFYSSMVVHFLGFAHKFLHVNPEAVIMMTMKVLNILTSSKELLDLVMRVDAAYHSKPCSLSSPFMDSLYKNVPSIREKLQDWEDGLSSTDNNVEGSYLLDNGSRDLKLFSTDEDGVHRMLELLILRAEAEIQSGSGEKLACTLQMFDSLKAQARVLFGANVRVEPGRPVSPAPQGHLVSPSGHAHIAGPACQGHHHREEVFTPKRPGIEERGFSAIRYKGDWMKRPITQGEVAWLARLLVRLSDYLNEVLGLDRSGQVCNDAARPLVRIDTVATSNGLSEVGLKEAFWMVLSWFVLLAQTPQKFLRGHGQRINLRILASKKIVILLLVFCILSALKKGLGLYSQVPTFLAFLVW